MKLISYNIQYGKGKDGRYDLARIAGEIKEADVIALQEVERFWQRSGNVDEPAELARHLPDFHWVYGANLDMDASTPNEQGQPLHRRRQFGTMILSRTPIISSRNFPLPKLGTLTQHSIQQGVLEAVIRAESGTPLRVYSIHLSHLAPATRLPQVDVLLEIVRRAPAEGGAWCGGHPNAAEGWTEGEVLPMPREAILMGDFNFRPDAQEYARIVGPVSPRHGRLNSLDGFVDSWVVAGHGELEGDSCSGGRIDYIFVASAWSDRVRAAWIDSGAQGSDHQPIGIRLEI
ncbi:MAG: endonuclease/exonuclease/phosphatase family protein [Pseudomonadota bacterium]